MKKLYKVVFSIGLFTCLFNMEAEAQTRLLNPKINVVSPTNVQEQSRTTPSITFVQLTEGPTRWIVLTPAEFANLTADEQQNAISKPNIFYVTEENKEQFVIALQSQKPVKNLILQQPVKK